MALAFRDIETKEEWDRFVFSHTQGALFQTWDWGEVMRTLGIPVWRVGGYDRGKITCLMQIVKITARRGTFLHVRHGPVSATYTPPLWRDITAFLTVRAKAEHAWFVRVSPQIADTQDNRANFAHLGYHAAPIHAMDAERCWVLDLTPSEDELMAGMRKTTRYEIRQAQKLGVVVRQSVDEKDLREFLTLYGTTASRHGFVPHKGIVEEFRQFTARGEASLFLGYHEHALVSGALVLFCGKQAIYHHGASVPSRVPVSVLVQWEAICEAKKRGMALYNFWGIAPEGAARHPWRGITLFKKGFGGSELTVIHAHDLPTSPFYWLSWGVESIRRISRGY